MATTRGHQPLGRPSARLRALRAGRKVAVSSVGATVVVLGIILLPLPGPGMLVVGLGLGILSTEYHWPARLAHRIRDEAECGRRRLRARRALNRDRRSAAAPPGSSRR
jgi:uncharacterized protein (TIGR02611 family)